MAKDNISAADEAKAVPAEPKTGRVRQKRLKSDEKSLNILTVQALSMLYQMMTDETLKPSDRLSAVKAALDYTGKFPEAERGNALTVVFENIPGEYAE